MQLLAILAGLDDDLRAGRARASRRDRLGRAHDLRGQRDWQRTARPAPEDVGCPTSAETRQHAAAPPASTNALRGVIALLRLALDPVALRRAPDRRPAAANCSPSTYTTVTLSLPPAVVRGVDQRADHGVADRRRVRVTVSAMDAESHQIASARRCRAAARRRPRTGSRAMSTKSGIAGRMRLGADVAVHLVAARMPHRLELRRSRCASSRSPTGE